MALDIYMTIEDNIATIKLVGELDASTAANFKEKIEEAASQNIKKLVLILDELNYMASAGIRVLVFCKQKMGNDVDIDIVNPQEMVLDTIQKTGIQYSVNIIENNLETSIS
jgi:anti-anti-sigma factor